MYSFLFVTVIGSLLKMAMRISVKNLIKNKKKIKMFMIIYKIKFK